MSSDVVMTEIFAHRAPAPTVVTSNLTPEDGREIREQCYGLALKELERGAGGGNGSAPRRSAARRLLDRATGGRL